MTEDQALDLIRAERARQISGEGYDAAHDDAHDKGEIMMAGMCYLGHALGTASYRDDGTPVSWPWEARYWKPKDKVRDFSRAGALMLAERERWERAGKTHFGPIDHKVSIVAREMAKLQ